MNTQFMYLNSSHLVGYDSNRTRVLRRVKVDSTVGKGLVDDGYALSFNQAKHLIRQVTNAGQSAGLPYATLDGVVDATTLSYADVLKTFAPQKVA